MNQPRMRWAWQLPSHRLHSVLPPRNRSVQPRANSFARRREEMCLQQSLGAPVLSTFGCQSPFFLAPLHSGAGCVEGHGGVTSCFLLFGSVLGSFIIGQSSQQFLGKNEVTFRNYLMIRKATERSESSGTFSFIKSSRSECADL